MATDLEIMTSYRRNFYGLHQLLMISNTSIVEPICAILRKKLWRQIIDIIPQINDKVESAR